MGVITGAWKAAWQGIKDVFSSIWNGIKEVFRVPINFVIRGINTFGGIINKVTDFAGLGKPILPVAEIGAQKGVRLPGYGGGDTVPAMLEPGEAVVPKHLVAEMAPWAAKHRIPGFADGGLVGVPLKDTTGQPVNQGGPWDWITDAASSVASGVSSIAGDIASAIADSAKWVYETGTKLFRIGAADALAGLLKGPEAAMALATKPFGKPGEMFDKSAVKVVDDIVAWVRGKEGPDPAAGGGGDTGGVADSNGVVAFAKTLVGCPYRPPYYDPSGFSCDGLVWYVFKHFGIDLPRGATNQMNAVQRLTSQASAQPGDVAGFHQDGPSGGNPLGLEFHHIGLVTGPNQMIAAQNPATGVVVTSISGNDQGPGHYDRFGRVLKNLNPGWGTAAYAAAHAGSAGHFTQAQVEAAMITVGAPANIAHIFSAIAMHENMASTRVTNKTGTYDSVYALQEAWTIPMGLDINRLNTDLLYASQVAYNLYKKSGFTPWEAFTTGAYAASMAEGGLVPGVQSYDRGGFLPPGLSVAYNGTGRPEPVGHASTVQNNSVTLTLNVANGDPVTMRAAAQQVVDDALTALARRLSSGAGRN
jgi:cell wall-associated NlpC family hydrolase